MNSAKCIFSLFLAVSLFCLWVNAQQAASGEGAAVPHLVNFSGKATDAQGKAISGIAGATFAIYKDQYEGSALWLETQNVQPDAKGNYSVQLGATKPDGLPLDLFSSGDARWLGVTINGGTEQPRVLLVSVPYALKAADAETLGGKPASVFLTAPSSRAGEGSPGAPAAEQTNEIVCASGTACKTAFVPLFASNGGSAKVSDSLISQSGSTLTIRGSDAIIGNESVSGNISASGLISSAFLNAVNSSAAAIVGTSHGTSGGSDGVDGVTTSSTASGVAGINQSGGIGVYGAGGTAIAGFGNSSGSGAAGVYGQLVSPITSNFGALQPPAGVWGSSGLSLNKGVGVVGTADDSTAGLFLNNSPSGFFPLLALDFNSSGYLFAATNIANNKGCFIDSVANFFCDGSKSAVVPLDGGKRKVAMSAIESPENWFEDFGSAQLINGVAVVRLDPDFIQTVNTEKNYRVFPVPNSDCKGLYVTHKTATSFEVHELGGGTSNISFDYRITAIRRKYETVRFADHTHDPDPGKMLEQMRNANPAASSAPALVKPVSLAGPGVPVAQLTTK